MQKRLNLFSRKSRFFISISCIRKAWQCLIGYRLAERGGVYRKSSQALRLKDYAFGYAYTLIRRLLHLSVRQLR